ncbi:5-deoxy-glucuronate isomerase [Salinarimonas soli]|uniref:5-deoxy-glucuronate isomerase n=1 Tax=Salinarimonas soli TaxID=1638099 RepID=A0A5B2V7A1_9HYPH|nr:5-deoxy-glucuronate isomerase [Salinarimonas soli]KAA2234666.1 5-deoxy-glucuronate isomerase [Salinarimonas soli]
MSDLLLKPSAREGRIHHVTPGSAGWTYVGFDLHGLRPGEGIEGETGDREVCLVLVTGRARILAGRRDFGVIGERMTPFSGKPWSVYVPAGHPWRVEAETGVELAVCSAPGGGTFEPRLIGPDAVGAETRGTGTNTRHVANILPESAPAHSLLVVEVVTPGGHWSSYPPHKHDRDALPHESLLEEVYYHRIEPPQGYALQRIYTDDRSLDEALVLTDGSVSLVPRGYHPVGAAHGYDLYYLNVMAGPKRTWRFHNDPDHEWLTLKAR